MTTKEKADHVLDIMEKFHELFSNATDFEWDELARALHLRMIKHRIPKHSVGGMVHRPVEVTFGYIDEQYTVTWHTHTNDY